MLKISKKGSYALKAVLYIAEHAGELVKVVDIASAQNIPESLLRRIISDLDKTEIIETTKGRGGGVKLAKSISTIAIYDILTAIGEELGISDCTKGGACSNSDTCSTTKIYHNLQTGFNSLLKMYTLDKIINK